MRMPSSLKLVIATWIAALLGALAGHSLAEGYGGGTPQKAQGAQSTHATVASHALAR
jgi:hypothetical protein